MPAFRRRSAWLAAAILAAVVVNAQSAAIDDCTRLFGKDAIASCTLVIDDDKTGAGARVFAYIVRARAALDISDLAKAEADIGAALALQPNSAFALRVRGRLRNIQGRNADARADYSKALELSDTPSSQHVSYLDRAQFLARIKEYQDALADFDAAIKLDATKARAFVGRALVYRTIYKIADALRDLEQATAVEPGYWQAHLERGDILFAEKRFADAVAAYDLVLAKSADNARAVRGRAAARAELEKQRAADAGAKPAPAETPAQTATPAPVPETTVSAPTVPAPAVPAPAGPAEAPSAPPTAAREPSPQVAEARRKSLQDARELRQKREFQKALSVYEDILRAAPADAEAAVEKGRTLMDLSRWQEAFDTFASVADSKVAPDEWKAQAYAGGGEVLAVNKRFDAAINATNSALKINPKLDNALLWRGVSRYNLGVFPAAAADFRDAGEIVPKSALYASWEALALLGAGDSAKAKEAIDRSLKLQPDNPNALLARARLQLMEGDVKSAEADLAEAQRRGLQGPVSLQTEQLIMVHKILKPTDQRTTLQGR